MNLDYMLLEQAAREQLEKVRSLFPRGRYAQELLRETLLGTAITDDEEKEKHRRMFDLGKYKHIGQNIIYTPASNIDTDTVAGVKALLARCMDPVYMRYDSETDVLMFGFLLDESDTELLWELIVCSRSASGYLETKTRYQLMPSEHIFEDIDNVIDREWQKQIRIWNTNQQQKMR